MPFRRDAVPAAVSDLLFKVKPALEIIPQTYLAGGTALSLYLAHRISIDLDFFTAASFPVDTLEQRLKEIGPYDQKRIADNTLICIITGVQFSLFQYSYPLLEEPNNFEGIRVASLRDIAAMKVVAIGHRGTRRDFYDLYALLNLVPMRISEVLEDTLRKYSLTRDGLYHYIRSLAYFDDAQKEPDIQSQVKMEIRWPGIESYYANLVRTLIP